MRLVSVELQGFRGFPTRQEVSLDADVAIVSGKNGTGKTSLFDAILWAITGTLSRLGEDHDPVSLYSPTGEVSVSLVTSRDGLDRVRVFRRLSSGDQVLRVECDGESFAGPLGEAKVIELFWPDAQFSSAPRESLARAFTQAVYLQQDLVRAFIESHDSRTRRGVVSELIGVGRVAELQRRLEQERASWSRATTELSKSRDSIQSRLTRTESSIQSLSAGSETAGDISEEWQDWWSRAMAASVSAPQVEPDHPRASAAVERALGELRSLRDRQLERSILARLALEGSARALSYEALESRLRTATDRVAQADAARVIAAKALEDAQIALSAERSEAAELTDRAEQAAVFAKLGLTQLGDRCPVCGQEYDREAAVQRLTNLVANASAPSRETDTSVVADSRTALEEAEGRLRASQAERRGLEIEAQAAQIDRARWLRTLEELHVPLEPAANLAFRLEELARDESGAELEVLITQGQAIGLRLARQFEASQRAELERQRASLESDLRPIVAELELREAAYAQATVAIEILRDHSAELLVDQLSEIEPTLQRIYSRIDPHPSFREAKLVLEPHRTRGGISAAVVDVLEGVSSSEPSKVLSSSQLNVLAASIFLALNLSMEAIPLRLAMLDDPLQSLDDLNLLGLVDVLRRVREVRQLLISTHDAAFADLLSRKLRPAPGGPPTIVVEVSAWGRQGPAIHQRAVQPDSKSLFLVAG